MKMHEALIASPPTPACFPDRDAWAAYLLMCQENGRRASDRPFSAAGIFRPIWNHCVDCTPGHAKAMAYTHRCKPSQFRGIAVVVNPALESA